MPVSCHFRDCKALLVTSLTHVSGAITSVQTFTFSSTKSGPGFSSGLILIRVFAGSLPRCSDSCHCMILIQVFARSLPRCSDSCHCMCRSFHQLREKRPTGDYEKYNKSHKMSCSAILRELVG